MLSRVRRNLYILKDAIHETDRLTFRRHLILFLLTCLTVVLSGINHSSKTTANGRYLDAVIYGFAMMAILLGHSLSRLIQARSYGVYSGLPFFIPMPLFSPFGTFGVITRTANVGVNTRALFDIAFWGPVVSFVLSLVFLILGTYLTEVVAGVAQFENPLILRLIAHALKDIPQGYDLAAHPLLAAGWAGLLFTAINLFPLGSLSGGQIAYALFGARQRDIAYGFLACLFVMALYYPMWFAFVLGFIYLGLEHPELKQFRNPLFFDVAQSTPRQSLDRRRQFLAVIVAVIFALSFTLRPFSAGLEKNREQDPYQPAPPHQFQPGPAPQTPHPGAELNDENSI